MSTYLVHLTPEAARQPDLSADSRFVRDGLSVVAFFVTPVWLLASKLWLGFLVWVLCSALLIAAFFWGAISGAVALLAYGLVALLFGLEAGALTSSGARKRKHLLVDLVTGDSAAEAARLYFASAAATSGNAAPASGAAVESEERQP